MKTQRKTIPVWKTIYFAGRSFLLVGKLNVGLLRGRGQGHGAVRRIVAYYEAGRIRWGWLHTMRLVAYDEAGRLRWGWLHTMRLVAYDEEDTRAWQQGEHCLDVKLLFLCWRIVVILPSASTVNCNTRKKRCSYKKPSAASTQPVRAIGRYRRRCRQTNRQRGEKAFFS